MRELIFSGYSDDTFGLNNDTTFDVDNCASGEPILIRVYSPSLDNGYIVSGQYYPKGLRGWHIGLSAIKNTSSRTPPYWDIKFVFNPKDEQMNLHITVEDDTVISEWV